MKKGQIILFSAIIICFWMGQYIYVPTLTPHAQSIGSSVTMLGLIGGTYGLMQFLTRIPIAIFSDMHNKRKSFVGVGMLFVVLSGLCFVTVKTPAGFLAARTLAGIAASFWAVFTVMFNSYFTNSVRAIGILNTCHMFGVTFSSLLGGFMSQHFGRNAPFVATIALSLAGVVMTLFLKESKIESRPLKLPDLLETGRDRTIIYLSVLGLAHQFVSFGSAYVFTPLVAKGLGMEDAQLGVLTFLYTLPGIVSALLIGTNLFKKTGMMKVLGLSFVLMALSLVPVVYTHSLWVIYVAQLALGFGRGISYSILLLLVVKSVPEGKKATATGFYQAIYALGMFLGPFLTGLISQNASFVPAYLIMGLICIVSAGSIFVHERKAGHAKEV